MGSCQSSQEARNLLSKMNDDFIEKKIKPLCETDMHRFWPKFAKRFIYKGWMGNVIAKVRSENEFRSAITFESEGVIYIIPGKVTNVGDAAEEVMILLKNDQPDILTEGNYHFVKGGVLDEAMNEITERPARLRNTCDLQTYEELLISKCQI